MTQPGQHGGYRQPTNPAPVSGPGEHSQRTDGGPTQPVRVPTGLPYGEHQQQEAVQQAQPLPATPNVRPAPVPQGPTADSLVPFAAPTTNPGQPVTAGANAGPGPGFNALARRKNGLGQISETLEKYAAMDTSGAIAQLIMEAQKRGL